MRSVLIFLLCSMVSGWAGPVISEFMASNRTTFKDGHGKYEDWIEIWNPDTVSVDLVGWRMTDTAASPAKFVFPTLVIPGGGRILVFAANRAGSTGGLTHRDPLGYLHTNFSLAKGGEYLALSSPLGVVATEFSPTFPQQLDDISYGQPSVTETLVGPASPLRYKVPVNATDDVAAVTWQQVGFNDASWKAAVGSGVGFEVGPPTAAWGLNEAAGATAAADATGQGAAAVLNGTGQQFGVAGVNMITNTALELNGAGGLTVPYRAVLNPAAAFSIAAWVYPTGGSNYRAVVSSRAETAGSIRGFTLHLSPAGRWEFWTGTGGNWDILSGPQAGLNQWTHLAATRDGAGNKKLFVNGLLVANSVGGYLPNNVASSGFHLGCGGEGGTQFRFTGKLDDVGFWAADLGQVLIAQHRTAGLVSFPTPLYVNHFQTDVQVGMAGIRPGLYTRHRFEVVDPARLASLRLRMKYDDGFVAYLNGTEILRRNRAGLRGFSSQADMDRGEEQAVVYDSVEVSGLALPALLPGGNVLAIHGMTYANSAENFLLVPVLEASLTPAAERPEYFVKATPLAANSGILAPPGPEISEVTQLPVQPTVGQALVVTVHLKPRLGAIAAATLTYRVMYGAESAAVPLVDLGPVPLATDGTRIYQGTIPASHGAAARRMLRYSITARDVNQRVWRAPYITDLSNENGASQSPEYFGTVIADATLTSSMPILQWFTADVPNSDTRLGSRASVFYGGVFYDNIQVRQRGGFTSLGSQKFNFNAGDGVFVNPIMGRVGEINLNSSGLDPSQFRVSTAYGLIRASGQAAPQAFPVALMLNGLPQRIAHLVEQEDEDFLKREGFDNDGALYKFVQRSGEQNTPGNVVGNDVSGSPGFKNEDPVYGVEKKTRLYEGLADYQAFTAGINTGSAAQRTQFFFSNMNLPSYVNFMAMRALIAETDVNRKNFYAFRDTIDSQEWFLFPWDKDLTMGIAYSMDAATNLNNPWQATNDFKHDPSGTKQWSILWQTGYDIPEVRAMVGRRLRTLMDTVLGPPSAAIPGSSLIEQKVEAVRASLLQPPSGMVVDMNYRDRVPFNTWLAQHRTALYVTYGPSSSYGMIPFEADPLPQIQITAVDPTPSTGNQDQESITLANPNSYAVDVSGWTLGKAGAALPILTLASGTVIPAAAGNALNVMKVVRSPVGYRSRPSAPTGPEYVVGSYRGQLSARGETLELRDGSRLVASSTTPAQPSAAQQQLRIVELNFAPSPPTSAETAALPGVTAGDFEFIELQNIGATALDLAGCHFGKGVTFGFPATPPTVLAAGARVVLVSRAVAFALRYPQVLMGGQFEESLDNSGETVQLLDAVGEIVVEFTYQPAWYPPADRGGRSLVTRQALPDFSRYDQPTSWALSGTAQGTPGAAETDAAQVYEGWQWDHFSAAEIFLPSPPALPSTRGPVPAGPAADADQDALSNLAEYAFGTDPRRAGSAESPVEVGEAVEGAAAYLTAKIRRRHQALDLTYQVQFSPDLLTWTSSTVQIGAVTVFADGMEQVVFRDLIPKGPLRFVRVRVVKNF